MNIKKLLIAIPAIAVMGISPAKAQSNMEMETQQPQMQQPLPGNNPDMPDMPEMTMDDMKQGWEDTKEAVQETYEKVRAALIDEDVEAAQIAYVEIDKRVTAKGMIDEPLYSTEGDVIGHIDDIVMNKLGRIETIVVRQGGFMGIGSKKVGLNYEQAMRTSMDGDVIMRVSTTMLDNAMPYSYDQAEVKEGENMQIMPAGNLRASRLLNSRVTDNMGDAVARAENIHFRDGTAERLIVSFNGAFGVGGEMASLEYDKLGLMQLDVDKYQYRMSQDQSERFNEFRQKKASY